MKEVLKNVWISRTPTLLLIAWRRRVLAGGWLVETVFFLLGAAFLVIPLFNFLFTPLSSPIPSLTWTDLITLLFILMGGLLVYRTLTLFTNTDRIEVTPQELKMRSRPLIPWDGTRCTLPVSFIESVDAKVISSRSGRGIGHAGVSVSYSVVALLTNGNSTTLVGGTAKAEPIYFIAHEINTYLKSLGAAE